MQEHDWARVPYFQLLEDIRKMHYAEINVIIKIDTKSTFFGLNMS